MHVRDGSLDITLASGPNINHWPSVGVRTLSSFCAEMGLSVGIFGGKELRVHGVIGLPQTGGLLFAEDLQNRIHRIQSRAIVKITSPSLVPYPFVGCYSRGLIPLHTAEKLKKSPFLSWLPAIVILGTGNRGLRFGAWLLDLGVPEVICVESYLKWDAKRYAGWEVEKRKFEISGGKILEGKPQKLIQKSPHLWEFYVKSAQGVRIIETAKVISAGPFMKHTGIKEYPPGSFLYELEQTALSTPEEDFEGWVLEEERAKLLAAKISKALTREPGRIKIQKFYKKAKLALKKAHAHFDHPFSPTYQGKWISKLDAKGIQNFPGVPQNAFHLRSVASIECFEDIPCNLCEKSCPETALSLGPKNQKILNEAKCTACGICLAHCPSDSIVMIHEKKEDSTSELTLPWKGAIAFKTGEFATLLNRKGETLGSGRVLFTQDHLGIQLVKVEIPTHLVWEARGVRKASALQKMATLLPSDFVDEKTEILLNGEKRLVRNEIPVLLALFETNRHRSLDPLFCSDGSCGHCALLVDGTKKLACQTKTHPGMHIRTLQEKELNPSVLCPCLNLSKEEVLEKIRYRQIQSLDTLLSAIHVGSGKCHGLLCMGPLKLLLKEQGIDISEWIDWRFPWSDWKVSL